jgi:hypothetical protein
MGRKARLDLVLDCGDPEKLAAFWREALGYRVCYESATRVILVPGDEGGNASPLELQQVPEPKSAKKRMHVDLVADDAVSEVERLELLGARRLHEGVQSVGPIQWVTLEDPEHNEFCVCTGVEW